MLLCAVPLSGQPAENSVVQVALLYRAQSGHRQAAAAIQRNLRDVGYRCTAIELPAETDDAARRTALQRLADIHPAVVATAGTKATQLALEMLPTTAVVFFMVPNALDAPFMAPDNQNRYRVAGVTTDIAPNEQINWLHRLCPQVKTLGVLTSDRSRRTTSVIEQAGRERSVNVIPIASRKDKFLPAIDELNAKDCDAVLMIPDANVYNSLSVQRLLLWGLRQEKPVLGFSHHVVKAGALAGQYSDNHAIGRQVAELIQRIVGGTDISAIGLRYPESVKYAVNERTAEMIGVSFCRERLAADTVYFGGKQ